MRAVMKFSERVAVLVAGRKIADGDPQSVVGQRRSRKGLSWRIASRVEGLCAGYGAVQVLDGISLGVNDGETVTLLGTNGNGKSTLMKCIMGIVPLERRTHHRGRSTASSTILPARRPRTSSISASRSSPRGGACFRGSPSRRTCCSARIDARRAPRSRAISRSASKPSRILAERRTQLAGSMSGGEQQMLTLARALMTAPKILLIDEPSVGLSPLLVIHIINQIRELKERYRSDGAHGGAEFPPGDPHRRPRLRDRPRQDRIRRRLARRALQQRADPQAVHGAVGRAGRGGLWFYHDRVWREVSAGRRVSSLIPEVR